MRDVPWGFVGGFAFIFLGYNTMNHFMQVAFYRRRGKDPVEWKSQPGSARGSGQEAEESWSPVLRLLSGAGDHGEDAHGEGTGDSWGVPHRRAPDHDLVSLTNLLVGSSMAGLCSELCRNGRSRMVFSAAAGGGGAKCVAVAVGAVVYQLLVEYYWHRAMHLPYFYKRFHKMHHHYKSPRPFDDLYIHPLESFGYYCILYAPPFLFPIHVLGFAAYMGIMGVAGVLDHSGVRLTIPGVYTTKDHDVHHQQFDCNYAFPFVWMDLLHGTFAGEYAGRTFPLGAARAHARRGKALE